jgi:osmotically-inducible protein OsmY
MKKRNVFTCCVFALILIAFLAACASTPDGENVSDMALAANVKAALEADPSLKAFNIGIETRDGEVYLTGWVGSQDDVVRAGQVAGSARGARSVKNNLTAR